MASVRLQVPKNTWVQVNFDSKNGVIELIEGEIMLTQQSALPTTTASDTPRNGRMSSAGQERTYNIGSEQSEFIYALGLVDSVVDITADGAR